MPSKPRKYGLKIFWACEAGSGYALNGKMYTGRKGDCPEKDLAKTITMELCKPFYESGRNITTDNFFTSHALACSLLEKKLTLLGTIRQYRKEVPKSLRKSRKREILSSDFRFDNINKMTLVSYVPKRNRCVILLSSLHYGREVEVGPQQKPLIIHDYNSAKGGVDQMDQNVEEFSVRRKTNRWPVLVFYNILDVACNNAYIIGRTNGNVSSRKMFLKNLSEQLAYPYMMERMRLPSLKLDTMACLRIFLRQEAGIKSVMNRAGDSYNMPRRCEVCRKSSRDACSICQSVVCASHKVTVKVVKCLACSSPANV
jgi:hypothetical protein